jgi:hypothetical protein
MSEELNTEAVETAASEVVITDEMVAAYALACDIATTPENEPGLRGTLVDLAAGRGHITVAVALAASELHEVIVSHFKNCGCCKDTVLVPMHESEVETAEEAVAECEQAA